MNKTIILTIAISSILFGKNLDIVSIMKKVHPAQQSDLLKISKELTESSYARHMISAKVLKSNIPNQGITLLCKTQPTACIPAKALLNMAEKSPYASELVAVTKYPLDAIRLHMKHGDKFLLNTQQFEVAIKKLSKQDIKILKNEFPKMPNLSPSLMDNVKDKFILSLRYTGDKGWKVSQKLLKFSEKHPKSATVSILMAWYLTNAESFFEEKEKLIKFLGSTVEEGTSDITKVGLNVSSGIANGITSSIEEKLNFSNIIIFILLVLSLGVWKLRKFIKSYFKIKMDGILNKEKIKSEPIEEGLL